ncbi:aldo/keto reductase [Streptomyces sp. NPDC001642]
MLPRVRPGPVGLRLGQAALPTTMSEARPAAYKPPRWRPALPVTAPRCCPGPGSPPVYQAGTSEEFVGRAIREYSRREDIVLATKVRGKMRDGPGGEGLSRKAILEQVDASLTRLGTDYIDLYQIHRFDDEVPVEETMEALHDIVRAGKVHYLGASSMYGRQFAKRQHAADLGGWTLTGKYRRGATPAPDTRAGSANELYQWVSAEYASSDRNWAVIDEVVRVAGESGATPAQAALSWIADRPGVVAPVFGARTLKQLRDGLGAVALTLDAEATAALDKVSAPTPGGYPYGAFGTSQRDRRLRGGAQALGDLVGNGSEHPTGRR